MSNNAFNDDPDIIRPMGASNQVFRNMNVEISPPPPPEPDPVVEAITADVPVAETAEMEDVVSERVDLPEDSSSDSTEVEFPTDRIDFRGEKAIDLITLLREVENTIGATSLDARVRTVGSWENLMLRAVTDVSDEEIRIQSFLGKLSPEERAGLAHRLLDETGTKTLLRTAAISSKGLASGEVKVLSGDEALIAFENLGSTKGGGYRIPLFNSGITVDVIAPTGNDLQTLLTNCMMIDRQMGASQGAHYFTYADQMFKAQIISFLQPLIVNCSYTDWRKNGKLWSVIKLPDLHPLVMTIAAICYKDGVDKFTAKCTRPHSETHPGGCSHTEEITANLFEMIVTRFAAMSKDAITFMTQARVGRNRNNLTELIGYQTSLGLEGARLTFGDVSLIMRIPSVNEHLDAGAAFLSEIMNEISGDNNEGRLSQVGLRYIRTFLPWIASVEKRGPNGEILKTSEPRVITRELEKIEDHDTDGALREELRHYVDKCQLTYVGYPATACPKCDWTADTPSGMLTFDPFIAFFTLAFQYLKPEM